MELKSRHTTPYAHMYILPKRAFFCSMRISAMARFPTGYRQDPIPCWEWRSYHLAQHPSAMNSNPNAKAICNTVLECIPGG